MQLVLIHGRVVFLRRVDITVAEKLRGEVDVAGFAVNLGAEGAPQLVRGDFFVRLEHAAVLLDEILDAADGETRASKREEEGRGVVRFALKKLLALGTDVGGEGGSDCVAEIHEGLAAAFADNSYGIKCEIYVINIQADKFAYTNSGSEEKRQNCRVTNICSFVKFLLALGQIDRITDIFN